MKYDCSSRTFVPDLVIVLIKVFVDTGELVIVIGVGFGCKNNGIFPPMSVNKEGFPSVKLAFEVNLSNRISFLVSIGSLSVGFAGVFLVFFLGLFLRLFLFVMVVVGLGRLLCSLGPGPVLGSVAGIIGVTLRLVSGVSTPIPAVPRLVLD